jgi:hypothetical protein
MAKTIKGLYCSPASDKGNGRSGSSCYTRDQLVQLATAYNNKYSSGSQINIRGNKEQLWQELENRMVQQCDTEWCWMDALGQKEFDNTFRPIRPVGKYQWLSTSDIRYVLKQYEEASVT